MPTPTRKRLVYSGLAIFAATILIAMVIWMFANYPSCGDWATAGQRGDYAGGHLSAAGSLVAAILLFLAIMLQREELQAQREELKLARSISVQQTREMQQQTLIAERALLINQVLQTYQLIVRSWIDTQRVQADIPRTLLRAREYVNELLQSDLLDETERTRLRKLVLAEWRQF